MVDQFNVDDISIAEHVLDDGVANFGREVAKAGPTFGYPLWKGWYNGLTKD